LKDAEKYRVEAEDQDSNESGNYENKADKPYFLFAEWGCMCIQNGKQAVEDDGEEDGVPNDDDGIARMVTPKGRFHIGGKAKSYCPTSQIVRFSGEMRQLADPPINDRTLIPRLAL